MVGALPLVVWPLELAANGARPGFRAQPEEAAFNLQSSQRLHMDSGAADWAPSPGTAENVYLLIIIITPTMKTTFVQPVYWPFSTKFPSNYRSGYIGVLHELATVSSKGEKNESKTCVQFKNHKWEVGCLGQFRVPCRLRGQ